MSDTTTGGNIDYSPHRIKTTAPLPELNYTREQATKLTDVLDSRFQLAQDYITLESALTAERERADKLEAELGALRERTAWRDIESAPKDGTEILLRRDGYAVVSAKWLVSHPWRDHPGPHGQYLYHWYTGEAFDFRMNFQPTHWMHMEPPQ